MERDIVAVVVTYKRKHLLKKNLMALLKQSYKSFDILVIDNNSSDGTYSEVVAPLLSKYDQLKYVNTKKNLGGAGGFQFGIRKAHQLNYKYVWLMDDDAIPAPMALEQLIKAYKQLQLKGKVGFLSSKVLWTDGSLCSMNIQRRTLTKNITDFSAKYIPCVIASFVSLFIPMQVIEKVGLPIKEFFIWTDDWEYTRRISRLYPGYVVTDSVVTHETKTNNGAKIATDINERINRYKYAYRNEMYFYRREGFKGIIHVLLRTPYHIYRVMRYSPDNKKLRVKIILKSTWHGLFFNPKIEMK